MKHLLHPLLIWTGMALFVASACRSATREAELSMESWDQLTIYEASWTDSSRAGAGLVEAALASRDDGPYLVANVVEWEGWPKMKEFTARASKEWVLVGDDGSRLPARSGTGGTSSGDGSLRAILIRPSGELPERGAGVTYRLDPLNQVDGARWHVLPKVRITR